MKRRKVTPKVSKFVNTLLNTLTVLWFVSGALFVFALIFWFIGLIPIVRKLLVGIFNDILGFSLIIPGNVVLLFFMIFMFLLVLIAFVFYAYEYIYTENHNKDQTEKD